MHSMTSMNIACQIHHHQMHVVLSKMHITALFLDMCLFLMVDFSLPRAVIALL